MKNIIVSITIITTIIMFEIYKYIIVLLKLLIIPTPITTRFMMTIKGNDKEYFYSNEVLRDINLN